MEIECDALDAAHVKLSCPDTAAHVVEPGSETVGGALANDTPRGGGTVEVALCASLVQGAGAVAPR